MGHNFIFIFYDYFSLIPSFVFISSLYCYSETGRREDIHAHAAGAHTLAGESDQVVRLPVAHAEVLRRREGRLLSARQAQGGNSYQCTFRYVEEVIY